MLFLLCSTISRLSDKNVFSCLIINNVHEANYCVHVLLVSDLNLHNGKKVKATDLVPAHLCIFYFLKSCLTPRVPVFWISVHLGGITKEFATRFGPQLSLFYFSSKTVSKRNGLLRRLRNVLPQKNLNMLYKALILLHLDYCDAVWGNAGKTQLRILDRLQNAAGKIILGLPHRYPTEILLNTLRWDKLENRRNLHLNILVYKSLTNTLPSPLCNIFLPVSNNHGQKTLSASYGNLVSQTNHSVSAKRKFTSRGATSFNLLPTRAKNPLPATIGLFKRACR